MTRRPHLIGIAGGSGSGKTTIAHHLAQRLTTPPAPVVPLDAYYRDRPEPRAAVNYDEPAAVDAALLVAHLRDLAAGATVDQPTYDFARHARSTVTRRIAPDHYVIVEGILTLHWRSVRDVLGTTVFVAVDDDTAFSRRLARDTRERGRTSASVRAQWDGTVRPMHARYVEPTRAMADVVVDGAERSEISVEAVLAHLRKHRPDTVDENLRDTSAPTFPRAATPLSRVR